MSAGEHPLFPAAGVKVYLRTLEAEDLDYLYRWENDPEVWQYGDCGVDPVSALAQERGKHVLHFPSTGERFSREVLRHFIENQQYDVLRTGQVRLVICRRDIAGTGTPVGFIDLFDLDFARLRAGVGILVCDPADRRKGYGREALELAVEYARRILGLCELWCSIDAGNVASLALFAAAGFVRTNAEYAGNAECLLSGAGYYHRQLL